MQNFIAAMVIFVAVAGLGLLQAPNDNAVLAAGLKLAADQAVAERDLDMIVELDDLDIVVTGTAQSRAEKSEIIGALEGLSAQGKVVDQIKVVRRVSPFVLQIVKSGDDYTAQGNIRAEKDRAVLMAIIGDTAKELQISAGAPDDWHHMITTALGALAQVETGTVNLSDDDFALTAILKTPREAEVLETILAGLGESVKTKRDLTLLDDGLPFSLFAYWDQTTGAVVKGKLPAGQDADQISAAFGANVDTSLKISALAAPNQVWADKLLPLAQVAGGLPSGTLSITQSGVVMTGIAQDQVHKDAIEAAVAALPERLETILRVTYLETRVPEMTLQYDAAIGASVSGFLPKGQGQGALASWLEIPEVTGDIITTTTALGKEIEPRLVGCATWMSVLENLSVILDNDALTITAEASPGVDLDLLVSDVSALLLPQDELSILPMSATPMPETQRLNAASGSGQIFLSGYWLPIADFDPNPESCAAHIAAAFEKQRIGFLSGSARIDGPSVKAINQITMIVRLCTEQGGLSAIIGGHTDNVGSAWGNLALSKERAAVVLAALLDRGLSPDKTSAEGYGIKRPCGG